MAKQIVSHIHSKNKKITLVGVREMFKGADIVNLREFAADGEDLIATKSGFTIPADQFATFFKSMRKFGRAAGLLPDAGEDAKAFVLKDLADLPEEEDDEEEEGDEVETPKKEKAAKKSKKEKKADKAEKKAKSKKEVAEVDGAEFDMKAFTKAIKKALKHADDISFSADVMAMYKANRKQLKNELPKRAVNALEKSMANKKDESLMAKAILSLEKHVLS